MSDLSFSDVDAECIIALPEKITPLVGKDSIYKYRPLAHSKGGNVIDFSFWHPTLHAPCGVRLNGNRASIMFLLPLNNKNLQNFINKYEECYRVCKKFAEINSPLTLDESGTAYRLHVKVDHNSIFDWSRLINRQLWVKPKIQWESIPLNTIKSLQLKLVNVEIVDSKPIEKKNIVAIPISQYNQAAINELQRQIEALASK